MSVHDTDPTTVEAHRVCSVDTCDWEGAVSVTMSDHETRDETVERYARFTCPDCWIEQGCDVVAGFERDGGDD